MAVCSTCGQENPAIARFCLACAAPLTAQTPAGRDVRKTITVVFSDVAGSTALGERLDPESLRGLMGRYFEEMRGVLERHGGTVEKFVGDAVMAVFGIPVLHEDDALRAVRATVEMREALTPLNDELERERGVRIQVRVGVNTGEVVAGDSAGGQAFATGDAVNVAARLEQAAQPGEILLGESTYRLVRDAVTVEAARSLSLRGKGEAVSAVRLLAVPEVTGRRLASPMVGRGHELELLDRAFDGVVRDHACRLVTVLGAAGVGKSRLVQEFLSGRADEATIVRGRCLSYGEGITFWPIKSVISQAAGLSGEESSQAAQEKIRSLVEYANDADLIVERVAEAIGVAKTVAGHRGSIWAIGRLFEELARRRPLVAVFDDLQWAEPTFLDLVEAVAEHSREAPILLLCMARPDLLEVRPAWGEADHDATRLHLTRLTDDESARLVANLFGAPELAREVRTRIIETAEGNPLFVEEIVAMLIDEGFLLRRNGPWLRQASGRGSPFHRRFRLCSPPALIGSDGKSGQCSSEARSRARSFIAAPSSAIAGDRPPRPRQAAANALGAGADPEPAFPTSRRSVSATSCFAMLPTSRCPKPCGRSCTNCSPAGSRRRPAIVPRNSKRSWAITSSRPIATGPTSVQSTSAHESSPRGRRTASGAPDYAPTPEATCGAQESCSLAPSACFPRTVSRG